MVRRYPTLGGRMVRRSLQWPRWIFRAETAGKKNSNYQFLWEGIFCPILPQNAESCPFSLPSPQTQETGRDLRWRTCVLQEQVLGCNIYPWSGGDWCSVYIMILLRVSRSLTIVLIINCLFLPSITHLAGIFHQVTNLKQNKKSSMKDEERQKLEFLSVSRLPVWACWALGTKHLLYVKAKYEL